MPEPSSKLDCVVDLSVFVDAAVSEAPVPLQGFRPRSVTWEVSPPATADTFDVTLSADVLPIDFGILRGLQLEGWFFEQGSGLERRRGRPGYFAGLVDEPTRNRDSNEVTLRCRDFTALPLRHELDAATLRSIDVHASRQLWELVDVFISHMPGGEHWRVVDLDGAGKVDLVETLGRTKTVPRTKRKTRPRKPTALSPPASRLQLQTARGPVLIEDGVEVFSPRTLTVVRKPVAPESSMVIAGPVPAGVTDGVLELPTRTITAAPIAPMVTVKTLRLVDLLGNGKINVWTAILKLCALVGAVADVRVAEDGKKTVALMSAGSYHTGGSSFDPFTRGGRTVRTLTYGERIGLKESVDLTRSDKRPDFVEVLSVDRDTGRRLAARWPEYSDKQITRGQLTGTSQSVQGVTSLAQLQVLAQSAWAALQRSEVKIDVSTTLPWSDGGGPDDPDLLAVRPSAALELRFAGFDQVQADPIDVLVARGIPRRSAALLVAASRAGDTSLIFQVRSSRHSWGPGGYEFSASLRRFLR